MSDKPKQEHPLAIRLWPSNSAWFEDFARMYNNDNAAFNIALLRAQGKGDYEIEQECLKHMRRRK